MASLLKKIQIINWSIMSEKIIKKNSKFYEDTQI